MAILRDKFCKQARLIFLRPLALAGTGCVPIWRMTSFGAMILCQNVSQIVHDSFNRSNQEGWGTLGMLTYPNRCSIVVLTLVDRMACYCLRFLPYLVHCLSNFLLTRVFLKSLPTELVQRLGLRVSYLLPGSLVDLNVSP